MSEQEEEQVSPYDKASATITMEKLQYLEIWKQLFEEMRSCVTYFVQITIALLVFLGSFAVSIHYIPDAKHVIWGGSLIGIIGICIHIIRVGRQQGKCYAAALEVQKKIIPKDIEHYMIEHYMNELMKSKKPESSKPWVQVFVVVALVVVWVFVGHFAEVYQIPTPTILLK
jgi:protein-S-isoprenylcysteine O-methyltransferase Ste14